MTVSLTPEQITWLNAHVARGEFTSIEDAVRRLLDERIAVWDVIEEDDFAWAKPYVDEAVKQAENGEVIGLDVYRDRIAARLDNLKD